MNSAYEVFRKSATRSKWSARFETWAQPLSSTEDQKCQNAENVINSAIVGHRELSGLNLNVFAQGSYVANTNVRADSDVDICVRCTNTYYYDLPAGVEKQSVPIIPATLDFSTYRQKLSTALYDKFTVNGVVPGDKAFKIKENTCRIQADVVPTFEYKKYFYHGSVLYTMSGTCFFTQSGRFIINWPEQTLTNGKKKNVDTKYRYKKVVRVLKGIRNEMESQGILSSKKISSFQIACLAYNMPDYYYGSYDFYDDVKNIASQIWYHTYEPHRSADWMEIDKIKPLFPIDGQLVKQAEVRDFFWDLMGYVGFRE